MSTYRKVTKQIFMLACATGGIIFALDRYGKSVDQADCQRDLEGIVARNTFNVQAHFSRRPEELPQAESLGDGPIAACSVPMPMSKEGRVGIMKWKRGTQGPFDIKTEGLFVAI